MSIFNEVQQLEELAVIGKALIKYAISIEPGLVFERHDGWWLPSIEKNFIGFRFHWSDMVSINLSLYGSPDEQFKQDDLIIKKGKFNYSKTLLTVESQLMAATVCAWRAHQLFYKERQIETGGLRLVDEVEAEQLAATASRGPENQRSQVTMADRTPQRYNEVRDFMKKNKVTA